MCIRGLLFFSELGRARARAFRAACGAGRALRRAVGLLRPLPVRAGARCAGVACGCAPWRMGGEECSGGARLSPLRTGCPDAPRRGGVSSRGAGVGDLRLAVLARGRAPSCRPSRRPCGVRGVSVRRPWAAVSWCGVPVRRGCRPVSCVARRGPASRSRAAPPRAAAFPQPLREEARARAVSAGAEGRRAWSRVTLRKCRHFPRGLQASGLFFCPRPSFFSSPRRPRFLPPGRAKKMCGPALPFGGQFVPLPSESSKHFDNCFVSKGFCPSGWSSNLPPRSRPARATESPRCRCAARS